MKSLFVYLHSPTNAVVLSMDEMTQIQALERTQRMREPVACGSFASVKGLVWHSRDYIEHWNGHPTPFVGTKEPADIIRQSVRRGR